MTTMEEVESSCDDPLSRTFADASGVRWETRMVVSSGAPGETPLIKIYSYQAAEVFEVPYEFADGLGLRTNAELMTLLENGKSSAGEK